MRLIDRDLEPPDWRPSPAGVTQQALAPSAPIGPRSASVRYVLDLAASSACGDLIREGDGLFEPDNPLFRLPVEHLWIELYVEPGTEPDGVNRRLGYLVTCAPEGRSGVIYPYAEGERGCARPLPCTIEFDLDRKLDRFPPALRLRTFQHAQIGHLTRLLRHSRLCVDEGWIRFETAHSRLALEHRIAELAEGTWFALPLLFAFAALLNSPNNVDLRSSDLARLNRARARRGRLPLLDHVEVRLALGSPAYGKDDPRGARATPRLHFVRGHLVHRAGRTFWRQAHLRGDGCRAFVTRTVNVTAAKAFRNCGSPGHVRRAVQAIGSA